MTLSFLACLSSEGSLPSVKYSTIGFLQSFVSSIIDITEFPSVAFVCTISTNMFLVRWGKMDEVSLLNASTHFFSDLDTCSKLNLLKCFVNAFTLSAYCAKFLPQISYKTFVWLVTTIESTEARICSHPILIANCNPVMNASYFDLLLYA